MNLGRVQCEEPFKFRIRAGVRQRVQVVDDENERLFKPPGQELQFGEGPGGFLVRSHGERCGEVGQHPAGCRVTPESP